MPFLDETSAPAESSTANANSTGPPRRIPTSFQRMVPRDALDTLSSQATSVAVTRDSQDNQDTPRRWNGPNGPSNALGPVTNRSVATGRIVSTGGDDTDQVYKTCPWCMSRSLYDVPNPSREQLQLARVTSNNEYLEEEMNGFCRSCVEINTRPTIPRTEDFFLSLNEDETKRPRARAFHGSREYEGPERDMVRTTVHSTAEDLTPWDMESTVPPGI